MKRQPRARPWLVELWVGAPHAKWWLIDQFATEAKAVERMQDIIERGNALAENLRVRFDPTPESNDGH